MLAPASSVSPIAVTAEVMSLGAGVSGMCLWQNLPGLRAAASGPLDLKCHAHPNLL